MIGRPTAIGSLLAPILASLGLHGAVAAIVFTSFAAEPLEPAIVLKVEIVSAQTNKTAGKTKGEGHKNGKAGKGAVPKQTALPKSAPRKPVPPNPVFTATRPPDPSPKPKQIKPSPPNPVFTAVRPIPPPKLKPRPRAKPKSKPKPRKLKTKTRRIKRQTRPSPTRAARPVRQQAARGPTGKTPGTSPAKGHGKAVNAAPAVGNPLPRYPRLARVRGWEGRVVLRVQVRANGAVRAIRVINSSGYDLLDRAAIKAVRRWRFRAAQVAGVSIASTVKVPIRFRLR